MSDSRFEVRPVERYDGARYPGLGGGEPSEQADEQRPSPLATLLVVLLAAGLVVGLIGCYMRSDYTPDDPRPPTPDGGPDPDCTPDALRCASDLVLEVCEDGEWAARACHDRCVEELGPFAFSDGCDAAAADPCLCGYDVIDGGVAQCVPGDLYCSDYHTLVLCEGGELVERDCDLYCPAEHGEDWASAGCDVTAVDPCRCFYDVLDGFMPSCEPGEMLCFDSETVGICDGVGYVVQACDDWCVEAHGPGWVSGGCNNVDEEPCRCLLPEEE